MGWRMVGTQAFMWRLVSYYYTQVTVDFLNLTLQMAEKQVTAVVPFGLRNTYNVYETQEKTTAFLSQ